MDSINSNNEKKGKRPRIGESRPISTGEQDNANTGTYNQNPEYKSDRQQGEYTPRPYQQNRPYNRQGGYNRYGNNDSFQRQGNGYNRYNNDYQPRQRRDYNTPASASEATEGAEQTASTEQNGYQPRHQGGYQPRQQGGYNNRQQGGYQPRQQGGYNNRQQGGYQPRQQGGYNNRQQGGYQPRQQGGYNNHQQGGYQPRQQGGYNNRQQGGYQPRQQGGYNNRQQGGYQPRQQGGYNNRQQGGYNNRNRQGMQGQRHNQFGMPHGGKSFIPRPKRIEYEITLPDPNEQIRLNKFMANAGICSRREADEFIQQGLVKVNGNVVTELGTKISHSDTVEYDDKLVALESKCYILLNKPKDCVTTSDDPNGRLTVMDLVKGACDERIYPVGRLDRNTTGVLLLTNDGDLASKLTHPKYVKKKIYHVWCDKDISEDDMQRIADGIELEDGPIHADAISYATETDRNQAGIEIHSGRNRIVRRIFESLGYHVTKLDRVYFAGLTKKNLPRGRWRYLTQEEVNFLKMGSFE